MTAHANAISNPHAMYQSKFSLETYKNADPISDPLTLFDIAPLGDGAAAVL